MKGALLFLLLIAFPGEEVKSRGGETAEVVRVIDGDTLKISFQGKQESTRLIGVDAPESRINRKARRDAKKTGRDLKEIIALGQKATEFVKSLIRTGERIKIEFDVRKRDRYSRLLAYVYLPSGKMLNEELIKNGFAIPMTVSPNVRYRERFLRGVSEE